MSYDVVIVGGSFAGLAVASQLRAHVLVVDRHPIGANPISANATSMSVIRAAGAWDSALQIHSLGMIYTRSGVATFRLPEPFATFDYARFCRALAGQGSFEFVTAVVSGMGDGVVHTDRGSFEGRAIVDGTGWHALAATEADGGPPGSRGFGVEAVGPGRGDGLGFWFDSSLLSPGYGWYFPAGGEARVGVGTFDGRTKLKSALRRLTTEVGVEAQERHGGWLNSGLRRPLARTVFLVGDAAGQCLPLTGEGIRPAVYFGRRCGALIQAALEGRVDFDEARSRYAALVARHRRGYCTLALLQAVIPRLPAWGIRAAIRAAQAGVLQRYAGAFPMSLPPERGARGRRPPRQRAARYTGGRYACRGGRCRGKGYW